MILFPQYPFQPEKSLRLNSSLPIPRGVTMPMPVTTTRWLLSVGRFLFMDCAPFGIPAENQRGVVPPEAKELERTVRNEAFLEPEVT